MIPGKGCFLRGKKPLPGNRGNLTEGFEEFPIILKGFDGVAMIAKDFND